MRDITTLRFCFVLFRLTTIYEFVRFVCPISWWRHEMETLPALVALCESWWRHQMEHFPRYWPFVRGNSPVPGEFPAQRPVTRSFDVFFYLRLNKRLSKQSRGWWFETLSRPLWRHRNEFGEHLHRPPVDSLPKDTSNGSWCIGIKGEMSGTVCVTFTWDIYIYMSCL